MSEEYITYATAKAIADSLNEDEVGAMHSVSCGYDLLYFDREDDTLAVNESLRHKLKLVGSYGFTELGQAVFDILYLRANRIQSDKKPEIGWLDPNGSYYHAEPKEYSTSMRLHIDIGQQIIRQFHHSYIEDDGQIPGQFQLAEPYLSSVGVYELLEDFGYIKVDMEQVYIPANKKPTLKQIDTLFDLYKHPDSKDLPKLKEAIRKFLVAHGMKFLSVPTDFVKKEDKHEDRT